MQLTTIIMYSLMWLSEIVEGDIASSRQKLVEPISKASYHNIQRWKYVDVTKHESTLGTNKYIVMVSSSMPPMELPAIDISPEVSPHPYRYTNFFKLLNSLPHGYQQLVGFHLDTIPAADEMETLVHDCRALHYCCQ